MLLDLTNLRRERDDAGLGADLDGCQLSVTTKSCMTPRTTQWFDAGLGLEVGLACNTEAHPREVGHG